MLFTNAAVQNRAFELDERPGKIAGIMAAQLLNRIVGNSDVVHCWNNVGMFDHDEAQEPNERLEDKYRSATMQRHRAYWGVGDNLEILTDDGQEFGDWATNVLAACLDGGDVYTETTDFHCCTDCDLVIAETAVDIDACGRCGNESLDLKTEKALFVDTPVDRQALLPVTSMYNAINVRQEQASMLQVPPRLLLSRTRSRGIGLDNLGLEGKVMDPRLGIGLLALYAADARGYQRGCLVQSTSTLVRTAPYVNAVITDPDRLQVPRLFFAGHTKVDQSLLVADAVTSRDLQVLLPLASLRRKKDVTPGDLMSLQIELSKVTAKINSNNELHDRLGLTDDGMAHAPESFAATIAEGRLNDLLPVMGKILGRSIESLKRLAPDQVSDEMRSSARAINAMTDHSRSVFGY